VTHCKHPTVPSEKMTASCNLMAQILSVPYHRVYDSRYLQADFQEPGSAPESSLGSRVWATFFCLIPKVGGTRPTGPIRRLRPNCFRHIQPTDRLGDYSRRIPVRMQKRIAPHSTHLSCVLRQLAALPVGRGVAT